MMSRIAVFVILLSFLVFNVVCMLNPLRWSEDDIKDKVVLKQFPIGTDRIDVVFGVNDDSNDYHFTSIGDDAETAYAYFGIENNKTAINERIETVCLGDYTYQPTLGIDSLLTYYIVYTYMLFDDSDKLVDVYVSKYSCTY